MKKILITPAKKFEIQIENIATDKSISHRCAIFSLLSDKPSYVADYLLGEDTLNTLSIAKMLGLKVEQISQNQMKFIPPESGIKEPENVLDCGNAGTAIRLYVGLFAGLKGYFVLSGDKYLRHRPMRRVIKPLKDIGAKIYAREENSLAPITIIGTKLKHFSYQSPISSAQIKSAMILAGLNADDTSYYSESMLSRDHTENMLKGMGTDIKIEGNKIRITPLDSALLPLDIRIPADPSSAFFFAVGAAIIPGAKVLLKNVLLNKTRIEAFEVLKKMGTKVEYTISNQDYEVVGDIYIEEKPLQAINIDKNISWLIDELPALSIAMAMAKGKSEVRNAKELRVKESDRIKSVVYNLKKAGIECEEFEDGYSIVGGELKSCSVDSFGDHRIAMSFAIAGLVNGIIIEDYQCIDVSFPNFLDILKNITEVQNK